MLGILGGMGPMATVDFLDKLVRETLATCDQNHIPFTVVALPQIPDRTDALLGVGPSPLPALLGGIDRLLAAGIKSMVIPCNTAHAWYHELAAYAHVPILHIADAVRDMLHRKRIPHGDIGLLATDGTIKADIYYTTLLKSGYTCRHPVAQERVMAGIRAVKAGNLDQAQALLAKEANDLLISGCRIVILGCSEVPIALAGCPELSNHILDASRALAQATILSQGAQLKDLSVYNNI